MNENKYKTSIQYQFTNTKLFYEVFYNCVLTPVYPILENLKRTDEQLGKLKEAHFKRIELSDSIYVINKDNYIGKSTKLEIEYAQKLGKEIMYLER